MHFQSIRGLIFAISLPKRLYDNYFKWDQGKQEYEPFQNYCPPPGQCEETNEKNYEKCDPNCERDPFKKGIHHVRVYLTNVKCKGNWGQGGDCREAWSLKNIKNGNSIYCGSAGADDSDEIFENYDVMCNAQKEFKTVVIAKITRGYPFYMKCRQGDVNNINHDCYQKKVGVPGLVNKNYRTQPAILKRISVSEVEIVADETPSEMLMDIENQIAALEAEVSDLHVAVDSVNIAPKDADLITVSSVHPGYGTKKVLVDGVKEIVDPVTREKKGKTSSFATSTQNFPWIAFDLGFKTEVSHVRLFNNIAGTPDNKDTCSHMVPVIDDQGNVKIDSNGTEVLEEKKDQGCYHYIEGIAWTQVYLSNKDPQNCVNRDCSSVFSKDSIVNEDSFWCGAVGNNGEDTLYDSWDQDCGESLSKFSKEKYQYVYLVKNTRVEQVSDTLFRGAWNENCDEACQLQLDSLEGTNRIDYLKGIVEPLQVKYNEIARTQKALAIAEVEIIAKETVSELLADLRNPKGQVAFLNRHIDSACLLGDYDPSANRRRSAGCPVHSRGASDSPGASASSNGDSDGNIGGIVGAVIAVLVVVVVVAVYVKKNSGAKSAQQRAQKNNISFENPMYASEGREMRDDAKENPLYDDTDVSGEDDQIYDDFDGDEMPEDAYDETEFDDGGYLDVDVVNNGGDDEYMDMYSGNNTANNTADNEINDDDLYDDF